MSRTGYQGDDAYGATMSGPTRGPAPGSVPGMMQRQGVGRPNSTGNSYNVHPSSQPQMNQNSDVFRRDDDPDFSDDGSRGNYEMSVSELLYSSSSYHAIAKPVSLTMTLAALAVVYVNTEETIEKGQEAMASAYQVWKTDDGSSSGGKTLALSLANSFVMVCVICGMTFVIVLLYRLKFMKCLIGYMIMCSATLLGILGGNLVHTALMIYNVPVDQFSLYFVLYNFCVVGVISVFWGQGIPKTVTQGYLIATSVILAWHLSYFDEWTTWTLLFMLALYDLCAVLTPCGPLRFLVDLMSKEDSPDMPGLLFEAELPPEARRPGVPSTSQTPKPNQQTASQQQTSSIIANSAAGSSAPPDSRGGEPANRSTAMPDMVMTNRSEDDPNDEPTEGPLVDIPLAIAKVYNLDVISIPPKSRKIFAINRKDEKGMQVSSSPLLDDSNTQKDLIPENPTSGQLCAEVQVRLPLQGGRIERVSKRGKKVYLERNRNGEPKRILWVDRSGKVFAEMRGDDENIGDQQERNSIRLGLGDFIFYSVLVAKAAQYSFATFAVCMLVILAGLGGTLVLLSVYHHALPALPISIFLGVFFYLVTRVVVEPWMEAVLLKPFYV